MALESKSTSIGHVEIKQGSDCWYQLWVDGELKEQSSDYNFIKSEYDKLY